MGQGLAALVGLVLGALAPWSGPFLGVLFGDTFAQAGPTLRWLLLGALAIYAGGPLLTGLLATGATKSVLRVALVALALNVLGNALLVPRLGPEGAALATLATEAWIAVGSALVLVRAGVDLSWRAWAWGAGPLAFLGAAFVSAACLPFAS